MYPIPPFDPQSGPGSRQHTSSLQDVSTGWVNTNPLYRNTGAGWDRPIPSAPPVETMYVSGSLTQMHGGRKGSYRDLLPDTSPLAILKQQALSSGGASPRFGSVAMGHALAPGQLTDPQVQPAAPSLYPPVPGASQAYDDVPGIYRAPAPSFSPLLQAYPQVPGASEAQAAQAPQAAYITGLQEYQNAVITVGQQSKTTLAAKINEPADSAKPFQPGPSKADLSRLQPAAFVKATSAANNMSRDYQTEHSQGGARTGDSGAFCKDSAQAQVLTPFLHVLSEHRRVCEAPAASPSGVLRSLDAVQQKITQNVGHLYTCFKEQQDRERAKLRQVSQALKVAEDKYVKAGVREDKGPSKATNILFLPYTLHPAQRKTRWFGILLASWQSKRTTWLAIIWACIFVLAVSLLIGLLVPWHKPPKPAQFSVPPVVLSMSNVSIDLSIRLDRPAALYYAVIPSALVSQQLRRRSLLHTLHPLAAQQDTAALGWPSPKQALTAWFSSWGRQQDRQRLQGRHRRLSQVQSRQRTQWDSHEDHDSLAGLNPWARMLATAGPPPPPPLTPPPSPSPPAPPPPLGMLGWVQADDVVNLAGGRSNSLSRYAAACGRVEVQDRTQNAYNLTVGSVLDSLECSTTLLGSVASAGQAGSGLPGQCLRCPRLWPLAHEYTVLLVSVREGKKKASSEVQVLEITHVTGSSWQTTVNGVVIG